MSAIACVVLGRAADVEPWAAAAALILAGDGRARGAGVVLWWAHGPDKGEGVPAAVPVPRARAVTAAAAGLETVGVGAVAHGRLVWATLPRDDDTAAAAAAQRVADATPAPCVLAMSGVREEVFERLLDGVPRVAVVGDPAAPLAALVIDGLADSGFDATCLPVATGAAALAARAGIGAAASLRRALAPLLGDAP